MAELDDPRRVEILDLDDLRPPPLQIRISGILYALPSELPLESLVEIMQLQDEMFAAKARDDEYRQAVADAEDVEEVGRLSEERAEQTKHEFDVLNRWHALLVDLMRMADPDVDPPRLSSQDIGRVTGFLISRRRTQLDPHAAIVEAIVGDGDASEGEGVDGDPPTGTASSPATRPRRSRSRRPSPSRSSD